MLPRWHVLFGLLFSLALFPFLHHLAWIVFLASVAIDADHYFLYIYEKKDWSLIRTYFYELHLDPKKVKGPRLIFFHTIEFLLAFLVVSLLLLNLTFIPLLVCIGFCFHVLVDFIYDVIKKSKLKKMFSLIIFIKQIRHIRQVKSRR